MQYAQDGVDLGEPVIYLTPEEFKPRAEPASRPFEASRARPPPPSRPARRRAVDMPRCRGAARRAGAYHGAILGYTYSLRGVYWLEGNWNHRAGPPARRLAPVAALSGLLEAASAR
jgi:hypothetical protein